MDWQEILEHPSLQDLPFKIETNAWGQIVMSPASNMHALRQAEISFLLRQHLPKGRSLTESSIATASGVRVPDVVWASDEFLERHGLVTPFPRAPEICVEVLSPSNTGAEMQEKITLYLARGAQEVWLCGDDGRLSFFSHEGEIDGSQLAPNVPRAL